MAYILAGVVLLEDEHAARQTARAVLSSSRINPFHWHREGPVARETMLDCLSQIGAVAHIGVHYPTGRKRTEAARERVLRHLVPLVMSEGAEHLSIESRGDVEDRRDRSVLLDVLNPLGGASALAYDWRGKDEPLLWLADAVCGATSDFLRQLPGKGHYLTKLQQVGVAADPIYLTSS